jgi:hypothetical protein
VEAGLVGGDQQLAALDRLQLVDTPVSSEIIARKLSLIWTALHTRNMQLKSSATYPL